MDMWIPMQKGSASLLLQQELDCRNHTRYYILSFEHALNFGLDARPSARGKFAQQLPVETRMDSQAFGDGENDLSVRDWQTYIFGDVDAGQQCPFLVTSHWEFDNLTHLRSARLSHWLTAA